MMIVRITAAHMMAMSSQSGDFRISCSIDMPFCMIYLGVVGKNGPSSEHCAFLAITLMYCNTTG